jgi:hypothetical protein
MLKEKQFWQLEGNVCECGQTFTSLNKLNQHWDTKHANGYYCKFGCRISFTTREDLREHNRINHILRLTSSKIDFKSIDFVDNETTFFVYTNDNTVPMQDSGKIF